MFVYFGQLIALDITQIVDSGATCDCETNNPARSSCVLNYAKNFEDLSTSMDYETIKRLKEAYDIDLDWFENEDDIRFYVGGSSERIIKGGATFSCEYLFDFWVNFLLKFKFYINFLFEKSQYFLKYEISII